MLSAPPETAAHSRCPGANSSFSCAKVRTFSTISFISV